MSRIPQWLAGALLASAVAIGAGPVPAAAEDVVKVERMSMELARDIAQGAVEACREEGYQVTAAVVDRTGDPQVVMRDVYAPEMSFRIARKKAYTAVMFSVDTVDLLGNRPDAGATMNHVEGVLFAEGGRLVETGGGAILGAVGVSGAPGGDIDARCAQAGIDGVSERLQFAGM
jgi:uncharacterized protein GlcG (DUF336 family)